MNKLHEKYYIPLEKLHEGENELDYNYKYFCAEFENYANPKRNKEYGLLNTTEIDYLKDEIIGNREFVQHYFHTLAKTLNIDNIFTDTQSNSFSNASYNFNFNEDEDEDPAVGKYGHPVMSPIYSIEKPDLSLLDDMKAKLQNIRQAV